MTTRSRENKKVGAGSSRAFWLAFGIVVSLVLLLVVSLVSLITTAWDRGYTDGRVIGQRDGYYSAYIQLIDKARAAGVRMPSQAATMGKRK